MHTSTPQPSLRPFGLFSVAILAIAMSGCQTLNLPAVFSSEQGSPHYVGLGAEPGFQLEPSRSEEIYHKVRQAHAQNSIVLHIVGDDTPARVLPLPPEQKTVFVSDLLEQTGVRKKLGSVDAILYRYAQGTIGGVRMKVKMSEDKRTVRPESDYALRAGDRLEVVKAKHATLDKLLDLAGGT